MLEYYVCARTVSCATASTCFHTGLRPNKLKWFWYNCTRDDRERNAAAAEWWLNPRGTHLVLRWSIFPQTVLSLSIMGAFGERKVLMLPYHHTCISRKLMFVLPFPPNISLNHFSDAERLLQISISIISVGTRCHRWQWEHLVVNTRWRPSTSKVFNFLNEHFYDRAIALDYCNHTICGMDCPLYSPDLTPFEFFCGCTWKTSYTTKIRKKSVKMKLYIFATCEIILALMLARVSINFVLRLHHAVVLKGGYIKNTII